MSKKELIELLFDSSNTDKNFQERFQSFLDQMPKPQGASSAISKESFFFNFFTGMFSGVKDSSLGRLGIKDVHFKYVGDELHIMAEKKKGNKELFVFKESRILKSKGDLEAEITSNVGQSIESKVTKVLVGRETIDPADKKKWKHTVLVDHRGNDAPILDESFKKLSNIRGIDLGKQVRTLGEDKANHNANVEAILVHSKALYSQLKEKGLIKNSNKEAAQHAFVTGILANFRRRLNVELKLELLTGRGYSDLAFIVRGENSNQKPTIYVIEFKADSQKRSATSKLPDGLVTARNEATSYIKGLPTNKIPTSVIPEQAVCIGVDLNRDAKKFYEISEPVKILSRKEPILQSFVNVVHNGNDIENMEKGLKDLLKVYYTFPSEQYTQDYLSRFLLGQMGIISKPEKAIAIRSYVFNHSEKEIKDKVSTFIFVTKESNNKDKIFVFHLQEGGSSFSDKYSFTQDVLKEIGVTKESVSKVNEVFLHGYREDKGSSQSAPSPAAYYENDRDLVKVKEKTVDEYFQGSFKEEGRTRSSRLKDKFRGEVQSVDNLKAKLVEQFKKAIDYQQKPDGLRREIEKIHESPGSQGKNEVKPVEFGNFINLLKNEVINNQKDTVKNYITNESRLKAYLDGTFTGLSDLLNGMGKGQVISVLPEFQVGGGGRADIIVQPRGPDSIAIGVELKYSVKKEKVPGQTASRQIEQYANSPNIKSVTSDKIAFTSLTFNKEDLSISSSGKFVVENVVHSSLTNNEDNLNAPGCSKRRKRGIVMPCVDLSNTEEIIAEKEYIQELIGTEVIEKINLQNLKNDVLNKYNQRLDIGFYSKNTNRNDLQEDAFKSAVQALLLSKKEKSKIITEGLQHKAYSNALVDLGRLLYDHRDHINNLDSKDCLNEFQKRIEKNELLRVAQGFYSNKVTQEGEPHATNGRLSTEYLATIFSEENMKSLLEEIKAYNKEVITISPIQIFNNEVNVYVKVGSDGEEITVGNVEQLRNPKSYVFDETTHDIKLKIDGEEYTLVEVLHGKEEQIHTKRKVDLPGGYRVNFDDLIRGFDNEAKQVINDRLYTLELLAKKRAIESIADHKIADRDYDNAINQLKQDLLVKGVKEEHFNKLKEGIKQLNTKVLVDDIQHLENELTKYNIDFDTNKFDFIKTQAIKGPKLFAMMAIYDLLDSIRDLPTVGRYDNNFLKKVFGINGILDSMNDVRESLSTVFIDGSTVRVEIPDNTLLGKLVHKLPDSVRNNFVRIIDNPVVQAITFATISYQFGYSIEEIANGNHHPLNYYWAASSGVKLTSMGVNFIAGRIVSNGLAMRTLSTAVSVLSKVSTITAVVDITIAVYLDISQAVEYTKYISKNIPLTTIQQIKLGASKTLLGELEEKIEGLFVNKDPSKKYDKIVEVKNYLSSIKERQVQIISHDTGILAIVEYVKGLNARCGGVSFSNYLNEKGNISSLNIQKGTLKFELSNLDGKEVYLDKDILHVPHLSKSEYDQGLRVVSVTKSFSIQDCTDKSFMDYVKSVVPFISPDCNNRTTCENLTFSSEPLILANNTREMSGALYYSSVPNQFIAAKNYPAIVVVPSGEVEQVGSRNYRTIFVVSDYSSGKLVGASSKDNTVVIDISNKNDLGNTVVFLDRGNIMYGPSEIKLENIYNIIANVQGNIRIFTDCKTRYVSVNSIGDSHIIQNYHDSCSDVDYEIRKVSRNNIHWRGVKLTNFIVDDNSHNAKILNMPRGQRIPNKKSIDIITIPQGGKVRVGRSIRNDLYTLAVKLGKNNIIIYIENFDNMQIKKDEVHYMVNIDTMKLEPTSTPSISYPIYLKHYKPSEEGLQIYRNSENNIGVLDLRDKSVVDFKMKLMNNTLVLQYQGNNFVKIEDWSKSKSIRNVAFLFGGGAIVYDEKCFYSNCSTQGIIKQLKKTRKEYRTLSELRLYQDCLERRFDVNDFVLSKSVRTCVLNKEPHFQGQVPYLLNPKYRELDEEISYQSEKLKEIKQHMQYYRRALIFDVAYNAKDMISSYNDKDFSPRVKHSIEYFKGQLPDSLKNIVFSSHVCIKNVRYNEYLYSPSVYYQHDGSRRNVFTWIPRDEKGEEFLWNFERVHHNVYHIKNVKYGEYLYSPIDDFKYDNNRRRALTFKDTEFVPKGEDRQSKWKITIVGNDVLIVNYQYNEHLYASVDHFNYKHPH